MKLKHKTNGVSSMLQMADHYEKFLQGELGALQEKADLVGLDYSCHACGLR